MARTNGQHPAPQTDAASECIEFSKAVAEGKEILEQINQGELRLGELADKIEPKYGDRTMAKFADALGIAECTLDRHRKTYRDWKPILAPGAKIAPYAVLRELAPYADNPECQNLVQNPNTTKREALHLKRKLQGKVQETKKAAVEAHWAKNRRKWCKELVIASQNIGRAVDFALNECTDDEGCRALLKVIDPLQSMNVRANCRSMIKLLDLFEALSNEPDTVDLSVLVEQWAYDGLPAKTDATAQEAPTMQAAV
jgi:hypothetical protein